jgi:hypothetical protein
MASAIDLKHCAACQRALVHEYFYLPDYPERYCGDCIRNRQRCFACWRPVGAQFWTLHDGRAICARCHFTAIYDPAKAQQLFQDTINAIVQQLGLKLRYGVEFRMVDAPMLDAIYQHGQSQLIPVERTLGLFQHQGDLRAIYILYGLPLLSFRTVVAHEYAHAWQAEVCKSMDNIPLVEGFAEWVAYRHLLFLGSRKAAQRMLQSDHAYRPYLQQILNMEQQFGAEYVIRAMQNNK